MPSRIASSALVQPMSLSLLLIPSLSESATSRDLDISEWFLLICGFVLVIGIFGEYGKLPKRLFTWSTAAFATLVMIAIAGELFGDAGVFIFSRHLQILEGADIRTLSQKSEAALANANDADNKAKSAVALVDLARGDSDAAKQSAGKAQILAHDARKEADSFEKDIMTAKEQAATAESHLAEALKKAADATAELKRLEAPRSLLDDSELVSALAPFKGTEYMFVSVFGDEESINLLKQIDGMLQRAEWKICQPGSSCQPKGRPFPPALNIFSHGTTLGVSQGVTTGITISVESTESVPSLQALPAEELPLHVRAALALSSNLSSRLSPPQENGVNKTLDVVSGTDPFVLIAVGKKP